MLHTIDTPSGFDKPIALPDEAVQNRDWQDRNRKWWEAHPMRYDWTDAIDQTEFTREFYQEIDRRFFSSANQFMPSQRHPFDRLIDFDALPNQDVLEIGVGNGSHAQLLAQHARSYTGIDLTDYAVASTSNRMKCFGIPADIRQMDAEQMTFEDNSFDFVWSWGVIHHSASTERILHQIHRVLRPGGTAVTMVYYRNVWNYYVMGGLFRGLVLGDLFRSKSLHKTVQRHTDGAIARFYTRSEWRRLVSRWLDVERISIYGNKAQLVPLPAGRFKNAVVKMIPDGIARLFTNRLRFGTYLVSVQKKPAAKGTTQDATGQAARAA